MKNLIVYGAGGGGKGVLRVIEGLNKQELEWDVRYFIDDNPKLVGSLLYGKEIVSYQSLGNIDHNSLFSISIASPRVRKEKWELLRMFGYSFPALVHPSVDISYRINIGYGCILYPGIIIAPDVCISDNVIINMGVTIGHDVVIGKHSVISPEVTFGGHSVIGENTFLGMSCCIHQGVKIGDNCIIGMGTVVLKDVSNNCVVVGNPGRVIKTLC